MLFSCAVIFAGTIPVCCAVTEANVLTDKLFIAPRASWHVAGVLAVLGFDLFRKNWAWMHLVRRELKFVAAFDALVWMRHYVHDYPLTPPWDDR